MTIALPQLAGTDLTTHSQRSCYMTCPRRAYYRYELGVRPKRSAAPLRLGSAVHLGLDLFAQGVHRDDAIARATASYEELPAWCQADDAAFDWRVERETVAALLAGYHWYWGVAAQGDGKVLATEQAFRLQLVNPDTGRPSRQFKRGGKIDKIVELPRGIAIREHKTTSDDIGSGSDYWLRLSIDSQISEYVVAARELGHNVETVEYDVIRKPSIRPRKLTRADITDIQLGRYCGIPADTRGDLHVGTIETPTLYGVRLLDDISARPGFYFARREIPRLDNDLDEHRRDTWAVMQQYALSRKHNRWYRNTAACQGRYGNCEYLRVCPDGIDPANPPAGFERVADVHPELAEAA